MIIYEVNIKVDPLILAEYKVWLDTHVEEMLEFPGFEDVDVSESEEDPSGCLLVCHYKIQNRQFLQDYLDTHAPRMREEGRKLFGDQFSASRRILKILQPR